ncbi:MAG TPA: hypothetical protein VHQ41_03455 [Patescibacteria group bacterium]|jgi:5'(3')-deoxyribonucleotidase|nr:hypothetical protein [Patescibacteria group bacterium]
MNKKLVILFGFENCLADTLGAMLNFLEFGGPKIKLYRKEFKKSKLARNIKDDSARQKVLANFGSEKFYYGLKPNPTALQIYRSLIDAGHDVKICARDYKGQTGATQRSRKRRWVGRCLGEEARKNMVFSSNKAELSADLIIDSRSSITSDREAINCGHWIIVGQPFNKQLPQNTIVPPVGRINSKWSNWEEIFSQLKFD